MGFLYFYIGSLIWYWIVIHYVFKEWKEDVTFFFFIMMFLPILIEKTRDLQKIDPDIGNLFVG